MSSNQLIAAKRAVCLPISFWPFCHPVMIAATLSMMLLTGCQTTTGMQSGSQANPAAKREPARSSTVTLATNPSTLSTPSTLPNSPHPAASSNASTPTKAATAEPVLQTLPKAPSQAPSRDPDAIQAQGAVSPQSKVGTLDMATEADKAAKVAKARAELGDIQVAEDYGVLFPADTPSVHNTQTAPAPATAVKAMPASGVSDGKASSEGKASGDAKPLAPPTVAISPDAVATDATNNADPTLNGADTNHPAAAAAPAKAEVPQPATPTAVIIRLPKPDQETVQQTLLNQARQHSTARPNATAALATGDDIPAFRQLMNAGVKQLRQGQLSSAQSTFTRAQRLAPQSSAVYFYLAQVALKQNQYLKAEAMARRGLVVAQTASSKKALWQLILLSAQYQGNQRVIAEAQAALSH